MILKSFKPQQNPYNRSIDIKLETPLLIQSFTQKSIDLPFSIQYVDDKAIGMIHESNILKSAGIVIYPTLISKKSNQPIKINIKNTSNSLVELKAETIIGHIICVYFQKIKLENPNQIKTVQQNSTLKCFAINQIQIEPNKSFCFQINQFQLMRQMIFYGVNQERIQTKFVKDQIIVFNKSNNTILISKNCFMGHFVQKNNLNIQFVQ